MVQRPEDTCNRNKGERATLSEFLRILKWDRSIALHFTSAAAEQWLCPWLFQLSHHFQLAGKKIHNFTPFFFQIIGHFPYPNITKSFWFESDQITKRLHCQDSMTRPQEHQQLPRTLPQGMLEALGSSRTMHLGWKLQAGPINKHNDKVGEWSNWSGGCRTARTSCRRSTGWKRGGPQGP